jgi:hypothetical protein
MESRPNRWSVMSRAQRIRAVGFMVAQVGFTALGLRRLARRPADRIPGRKWIWAAVITANLAGTLAVRIGRLASVPRHIQATATP